MTIGQRIRERRKELGLSQEELAKRLGNKSRASVCTVERDKEDLTIDRIRKYAEALYCEPGYLTGWISNKPTENPNKSNVVDHEIPIAIDMYEKYKSAPPEIQAAVELLLKQSQ